MLKQVHVRKPDPENVVINQTLLCGSRLKFYLIRRRKSVPTTSE